MKCRIKLKDKVGYNKKAPNQQSHCYGAEEQIYLFFSRVQSFGKVRINKNTTKLFGKISYVTVQGKEKNKVD